MTRSKGPAPGAPSGARPSAARRRRALAVAAGALGLLLGWLIFKVGIEPALARGKLPRREAVTAAAEPNEARPSHAMRPPLPSVMPEVRTNPKALVPGVSEQPGTPYYERDLGEYQGRPIPKLDIACEVASSCGRAAGCVGGLCAPCRKDSDCAPGEACAVDNCLLPDNVKCRSRRDCPAGWLCALTEDPVTGRGNQGVRAYCDDPKVGHPQPATQSPAPLVNKGAEPAAPENAVAPLEVTDLLEAMKQERAAARRK